MTYVSPVMKGIGYFLCVFQIIASLGAIAWTFLYRKHKVVSLSQPIFLHLVSFGCLLMILSIIPLGMEGDYRYEKDPDTPGMLDMNSPSSDTVSLDAACKFCLLFVFFTMPNRSIIRCTLIADNFP